MTEVPVVIGEEESPAVVDETSECQVCFTLPPEEMLARVDSCRVLRAIQMHSTPRQLEASLEVISALSLADGKATKAEVDGHVADVMDISVSSAGTHFNRTRALLRSLFGEDAVTNERDPETRTHSYTVDPAVIGQSCIGEDPIVKSGNQELPGSYRNIERDQATINLARNFILDLPKDAEAGAVMLRREIADAIEKAGLHKVAASVSAAQKLILSEKYIHRYLRDPSAVERFSYLNEVIRSFSLGRAVDSSPSQQETPEDSVVEDEKQE